MHAAYMSFAVVAEDFQSFGVADAAAVEVQWLMCDLLSHYYCCCRRHQDC